MDQHTLLRAGLVFNAVVVTLLAEWTGHKGLTRAGYFALGAALTMMQCGLW